MLLLAVLFHRSGRRRPHRDEPRPSHSDVQDSSDDLVAGGNISNRFRWTRPRLLHHGFVPRQRRAFGNCANTPIIWAVSRPTSSTSGVSLWAFSGLAASGSYPLLFGPMNVGPWPNTGGNANIVPTVSNGRVYVASWQTLTILSPGATTSAAAPRAQAAVAAAVSPGALSKSRGPFTASTGRRSPSQIAMARRD